MGKNNQNKYGLSKQRYITIPKRMSGQTLLAILKDEFGEEQGEKFYNSIMSWFHVNPKKTTAHIENLKIKIRKWGHEYSIEEA